jgi:DNA-binding Lrp family transcriptional regulator
MDNLNRKDRKIVNLLKEDGRISDAEIARRMNLSKTTVRWRRMKLIEEKKIKILGVIIFDNVGYSYARVGIKLKKDTPHLEVEEFEKKIVVGENVYSLFETIGIYDLIVGFCAQKAQDLYKIIHETLRGNKIVMDYDVTIYVKALKMWGTQV